MAHTNRTTERVHIDVSGSVKQQYLIATVDTNAKLPKIFPVKTITSPITIVILRRLFAQFGIPESLVADNGPQFTSAVRPWEFNVFADVYHRQLNGQTERLVHTAKITIKKLQREEDVVKIPGSFLMTSCSTPNLAIPNNALPAKAFLGGRMRIQYQLFGMIKC